MNAEATRVRHIVTGIGINVNQAEFPAELRQTATSLRISTGNKWSRVDLCAALLKSLDREYQNLTSNPAAHDDILKRFEEQSSMVRGKTVRVEENGGFEGMPRKALIRAAFCWFALTLDCGLCTVGQ